MTQPYTVEQFDAVSGTVSRRTITPLPEPTRLKPAAPIEQTELLNMIEELRQEMGENQERFDNKDSIDAERTAKRHELNARIIELIQQTNELKAELDSLNREGSVRQQFIEFAKKAESRIQAIATGAYNFLLNKFSQERHEANYAELTDLLKEDVRFKVDRSGIKFLTQPSFATLHRVPADKVVNAQVEAVLEKVYTATEKLEAAVEK
jgi:chromosome segregation ATPase